MPDHFLTGGVTGFVGIGAAISIVDAEFHARPAAIADRGCTDSSVQKLLTAISIGIACFVFSGAQQRH